MDRKKKPNRGSSGSGPASARALIVDDEPGMRELLMTILEDDGWEVEGAQDGKSALAKLSEFEADVLLSDLKMPEMDGMALLRHLSHRDPALPVVVLTAYGSVEGAVEAMKLGAFDFLTKPLPEPETLRETMARALRSRGSGREARSPGQGPIGKDPAFIELLEMAKAVAPRSTTVLIHGESGTGKEVVARFIHQESQRSQGPFVAINCAAIPENLLESQLFGHEKGAFTGAAKRHEGLFRQAHGGTLLLDEVAEMALALQSKLLRVLETGRLTPVGAEETVDVDVRLLAATNRNLGSEVESGRFRRDLFFRLNVFPLELPPLRERRQDILLLARHFLNLLGRGVGKVAPTLTTSAQRALLHHPWPGNIRELQNVLERAYILSKGGEIEPRHLGIDVGREVGQGLASDSDSDSEPGPDLEPDSESEPGPDLEPDSDSEPGPDLEPDSESESTSADPPAEKGTGEALTLKELERHAIEKALEATGGNRKKAAKRLGIAVRTLHYKIKQYGLK